MKKTFFFTVVLCLLVSSSVFGAQPLTLWDNVYSGKYNVNDFGFAQQTADDGFILTGQAGFEGVYLVKTDSAGNQQWEKTFGEGSSYDEGYCVKQTSDGGYIVAATTDSYGAGKRDFWLIKVNSSGIEQWNKTFGGTEYEDAYSVEQTSDGGYIIAGSTSSYGAGSSDFWLVKTDSAGIKQWDKTFGGASLDMAFSVEQTSDGGYAIAGYTYSFGAGSWDYWLVKTDSSGNEQWNKTYGGSSYDYGRYARQTFDGGFIFVGYTKSYGAGGYDVWLVKTDSSGNKIWDKTYGGSSDDNGYSVSQDSDSGYIISGSTESFGAGGDDYYLIKTDSSGNVEWDETFGGSADDYSRSAQQTSDGGYFIAGQSSSYISGQRHIWLIRLGEDVTSPEVANVVPSTGTSIATTNINIDVTFSEQVFGVDISDMVISGTAATSASLGTPTDLGSNVWRFPITGLVNGMLNIDLAPDASDIQDIAGNDLSPSPTQWNYTVGLPVLISGYIHNCNDVALDGVFVSCDNSGGADTTDINGYYELTVPYGWSGIVTPTKTQIFFNPPGISFNNIIEDKSENDFTINNGLWSKTFGGTNPDEGKSVKQTTDGGYIIAGSTESYGAGDSDVWIIKTDASGIQQWSQTFGGVNHDSTSSIWQTTDGGYIIAGSTESYGAGAYDVWLIKTDASGSQQWNKTFGGVNYDSTSSVQQTTDGGYIMVGYTESYGAGASDIWLIKTDASGNQEWNKTFGGTNTDSASSVRQTVDGGYIIAGSTYSYGAGLRDVWLIKVDSSGNEVWSNTFGGSDSEYGRSVQQTQDGGYIVAGQTYSYGAERTDVYLLKIDSNGNEEWSKTFGGVEHDNAFSVIQDEDEGYVIAGFYGAANVNYWIIKTDSSGNKKWEQFIAEKEWQIPYSIEHTSDGGYIVVGASDDYPINNEDIYLVKIPQVVWGDFEPNCDVDIADFSTLSDTWGLSSGETGYNNKCDLVDNDLIDIADLAIFINYWLQNTR